MRLDLLLTRLRFSKSRSVAQARIAEAHMRLNGQRVTRQDQRVGVGDVLTFSMGQQVRVIEILALPERRGPPAEARSCYRALDAGDSFAIAGQQPHDAAARI